jgi:CYTH domain-containing protein
MDICSYWRRRYFYSYNGRNCEIDVFQDKMKSLIVIDLEFASSEEIRVQKDYFLGHINI